MYISTGSCVARVASRREKNAFSGAPAEPTDPSDEAIRLYCGCCEESWNRLPVSIGPFACVSPVHGQSPRSGRVNAVALPRDTLVMQDSGAFSDGQVRFSRDPGRSSPLQRLYRSGRLTHEEALERQIYHADRFGYAGQITHRASYDVLIDCALGREWEWRPGNFLLIEEEAWEACVVTIEAARFLSRNRCGVQHCVLTAQGVSPRQYLACAQRVLPFLERGDVFGLGGWSRMGKAPLRALSAFRATIGLLIPFLGSEQVERVHLWGVCFAPALGELLWLCDQFGIKLSIDTVGPSLRPVFGRWGYATWTNHAYRRPKGEELGRDRETHVRLTRCWLGDFRHREPRHYRSPRGIGGYTRTPALFARMAVTAADR